jgi:hypothetical protein
MNNTQLVQDVHDGTESAVKAWDILFAQLIHINKCMESIKPIVEFERNKQHISN